MTRTEELRAGGRRPRGSEIPHAPNSARELLVASVGADPFERIEELRDLGQRKAEATGLAYQLERERKHLLARLATEYAATHAKENLSEAKLERLARADQRYLDHIRGTAAAVEGRELAHSEYWAARSILEWDRAALAHVNAMSRLEEPA